jgi:hypothetical protein
MDFEDKSGQPPSARDVDEAIATVGRFIVRAIGTLPPELAIQLPNIHRCLRYLREIAPR